MEAQAAGHIVDVLMMSSVYVLAALGFALVFSTMRIMNFAHGAIYMVSSYACYYFWVALGLGPWLSLVLTMSFMALFGLFLERFCFRPFFGNFEKSTIVSIILIFALKTGADLTVGPSAKTLPPIAKGVLRLGDFGLGADRLAVLLVCAILLTALTIFVQRSKIGQAILAVAEDREAAALYGININRVSSFAFLAGCAMAGLAGGVTGSALVLHVGVADVMLVRIIAVVILSGMGTIGGIWAGGLIVGAVDAICPYFFPAVASDLVVFAVILVVLVVRPKGFFGREV